METLKLKPGDKILVLKDGSWEGTDYKKDDVVTIAPPEDGISHGVDKSGYLIHTEAADCITSKGKIVRLCLQNSSQYGLEGKLFEEPIIHEPLIFN